MTFTAGSSSDPSWQFTKFCLRLTWRLDRQSYINIQGGIFYAEVMTHLISYICINIALDMTITFRVNQTRQIFSDSGVLILAVLLSLTVGK